jgi:hypothetical protein
MRYEPYRRADLCYRKYNNLEIFGEIAYVYLKLEFDKTRKCYVGHEGSLLKDASPQSG